ncbi:hypothetical protein HYZ80_02450 [Candidatus Parcubacteria bacterium]|nr:hypothetical protein [Candidatus Parcubacteria bacterium]
MNKELAILLGLLYTDGCVSPKGQSWRIYFAVKSQVLVNLFRDCMVDVFALESNRVRIGVTQDGLTRAIVNSKEVGNWLVGRFGTFRTLKFANGRLPPARLPVSLLKSTRHVADFLRIAFSCDGGVSFYSAKRDGRNGGTRWLIRTVFLACTHPQLRRDYLKLLSQLGIRVREVAKDGKLKMETERDIRLFQERIGFTAGVRVTGNSKFWNGYEKNEVLRLLIASYGRPSKIYQLPKFNEVMI